MDQSDKDSKLFQEFPPISTETWEEKILADLKGANYEKKLVWRTMEGFKVRPYYRAEDLRNLDHLNVNPGEYPFVRGNKKENSWLVRQDIKVKQIKEANAKALEILNKGVDSLGFIFTPEYEPTVQDIEELLEGVYAECVELNFDAYTASHKVVAIIEQLTEKYERDAQKIFGSVNYDPISKFVLKGRFFKDEDNAFAIAKQITDAAESLPQFKTLSVNGYVYHNAGSSIVQELAFSLASGAEYINKLGEQGLNVDQIAPRIKFNFAVGSNYFMEIAKMRAARLLWTKIVEAFGSNEENSMRMHIHAVTSDWNKTLYDPYVNMLRTTTEAMSSIIGGIDSLTVNPFNSSFEDSTDFSERIARNQQLLLKEESYFDKVVDPSAGSYYIETLTDNIAEQAWKLFLEIEEAGGFIAALRKGIVQNYITETATKRDQNIATRKENFLGTNQFPNFTEYLKEEVSEKIINPSDEAGADSEIETLKPYRGAMAFERLRYKTDMFARENKRPSAFMFTYGNMAFSKARSEFARNFFAIAGFEAIDNKGFKTLEDGIKAALEAQAEVVVICSSDDEYATIAPQIFEQLKDKTKVVVAGAPACMDELKSKGIEHFINVKSNVLETLQKFQKDLQI
ncbi:MAG: methylmalonyl-CoA mutase small subunit [Bacteroidales bacterium]|nr:methylmalonyl-CoA mutase small subunit [Bacteroidales bacterium]